MQVVVSDLLTNYELTGKGKLIVFLHGWADSTGGSKVLRGELSRKYKVLAPDLPGFGKTQSPPGAWDLDNYAEWLTQLLKKLDLEQPYAIIGHSNGGAIAIRGINLGLFTPKKLVLVASAGIRKTQTFRKAFLQVVAKTGNLATIGLPERYRRALRRQLYKSAGSDLLIVESMQDTFKKTVKQDVQLDAKQVKQPTLLIFGGKDQAVPPYMGERFNQLIAGSTLQLLPNAGHFVHLDEPEQTKKLIEEFLR